MRMKSLQGKSVLITGATGGIGQAFSRQLAELGARVILAGRNRDLLEKTAGDLQSGPGGVAGTIVSDISTMDGCERLFEETRQITSGPDMLINNAGIINYGSFPDIPGDQWETLIGLNLLAPMRLCRLFIPEMIARGQGHLVFICSLAGLAATSMSTPYTASKFGMRGFAMGLSGDLKGTGIDVTIVYPSWVRTKLLQSPEFGAAKAGRVPRLLNEDPQRVVRSAIKGIRKNKRHVCPGPFARLVWYASKFWPIVAKQAH